MNDAYIKFDKPPLVAFHAKSAGKTESPFTVQISIKMLSHKYIVYLQTRFCENLKGAFVFSC